MVIWMSVNNGTKSSFCSVHWSVNKGKLGDVILVNHAQNGLVWHGMLLRVHVVCLICCLKFSKTVVRNQTKSLLLRLSFECS